MDPIILDFIQQKHPQIAERELQEEIAQVGKLMYFKKGDIILDYGSYVRYVPLIIDGVIKVSREGDEGHELFLYYLEVGQTCSMSFTCCMMNKKSDIRTTAEEDTTVVGIPMRYMDEFFKYQSWKNYIMRSYDERMKELVQTIDNIAFKKLDERLLDYLRKKVKVNNDPAISITHQKIAYDLNASREAISRLLKQLEKAKRVALERNMVILSLKEMEKYSESDS